MLFKGRKEEEAKAAREAAGESLWTTEFGPNLRNRIWRAFRDSFRQPAEIDLENRWESICGMARELILDDSGLLTLREVSVASQDLGMYLLAGTNSDEVCSVVEAMAITAIEVAKLQPHWRSKNFDFGDAINDALSRERTAYQLVGTMMVEKDSEELHSQVVEPVLRLLAGRPGWATVERSYQTALKEIADDNADDAITDVGRALQQALGLLGCEGNNLGALIASAKKQGLLAAHDPTLAAGILKFMDWVSADRSEMGDGHVDSAANREDAWLAVHVVGALILRLAGSARSSPQGR